MRGGKRPGAGRVKGVPNKSTKDIKALAQKYGPDALKTLDDIRRASESDAARVAAARELLDRAYGKAAQPVTGEGGEGPMRLELSWRPSA